MTRARGTVAVLVAALLASLAASEIVASRDRAAAGEVEVDRDVGPARESLSAALLAIERRAAAAADAAIRATADVTDPGALFAALADVPLPDGAGLFLEDVNAHVLAWSGATIDDAAFAAMPRTSDGTWLAETSTSRRVAVRRARASPRLNDGVPFLAVCHVPFEVRFPLRNRALTRSSLADDVARQFRVAEDLAVLPPGPTEGEPLSSAFGGEFARLDVRGLSVESWNEAVDEAADRRRAAIFGALTLLVAAALWRETAAMSRAGAARIVRAAIALGARAALGLVPLSQVAGVGALTDAGRYSRPLVLDLAGSPMSFLLTCAALCLAAANLRRAAHETPATPGPLWRTLAVALAAALACRLGLAALVDDAVVNSRVEFFSADTVLPRAASSTMLAALVAAGMAAVFAIEAAWALVPPAGRLPAARALAVSLVLALVAAPIQLDAPHAAALGVFAVAGLAAAFAASLAGTGVAARAALVPIGAAAAVFAPLDAELQEATRKSVEREAGDRVSRTIGAERLFVADALEGAAADPRFQSALSAGRLPRDLALTLWAKSPLARRPGGSSLEIAPLVGFGDPQRFSADLPPATWLPDPASYPPPGEVSAEPLPGRGSGADGRWIVGETKVEAGGRPAATLRVVLEVRPPATTLPELRILGATHAPDDREAPPLAVTVYSPAGVLIDTDDPYRPAGSPLDPDLLRAVSAAPHETWRAAARPDRELEVFVRADVEDGAVTAIHAFSYDTGGAWALVLRATRISLFGAIVSLVALLATARSWARRARLRLVQRLVISYVLVAALPLSILAWANRAIAQERVEETTRRELGEAIALLRSALHERNVVEALADLPPIGGPVRDIRSIAYAIGHHANVFIGPRLVAGSDQGLFDTELLPTRLPGPVYRNLFLSGQPFERTEASVGGFGFDVGYAALRVASDGEVTGAVSVPLLHQRRLRDAELASAMTAVLGLYLASLVAAVAVGILLARRLTKPLSDLTEAARRVARGDLERPVPGAGPDELGEVVTAFNQMQRDLGESRAKLVKAEKEAAWRDMARQVAHEVKNPLTPMRLAAEHLRRAWRDKVPQFDEVLERGVELIVRQTESLQRIATAFSDFARFPNRRREPVDVASLLDEVLDLWRGAESLVIQREIGRPLPSLPADPDELRRVLVNLANNAVEALEGRKGTLTARLAQEGASLVLTIGDDGPGIPDEILPRLFEPYLSTKTKGTGLGLAICKRAIEDLGGTIAIESRRGEGTTVTVRLPLPQGRS